MRLLSQGVSYFGCGGALGFDTLCALTVLKAREARPGPRLILVLPCPEQAQKWDRRDQEVYEMIKAKADKVVFTSPRYHRGCMFQRNRYLVDHSGTCVCYLTESAGGTFYTVRYARNQGLSVLNLAPSGDLPL